MPPRRQATPASSSPSRPSRPPPGPLLTPGRPALPRGWTPEGVIEALEPLSEERRRRRLTEVMGARVGSVTLLLDTPHDPHNGSAVVRSADAFGVPELHVVHGDDAFLVGHRVAQGSERWVEVVRHTTAQEAVAALRSRSFKLLVTHPEGSLLPHQLAGIERVCLVLGNEHAGVSAELRAAADDTLRIPMRGFVESLNLSVAAAVLLSAALAERPGDLALEERRRWYAVGLLRSVPRAEEILGALGAR